MGERAVIYVRISDDQEGDAHGVLAQQKDCEELAADLGLTVGRIYADNDVSAFTGRRRPDFEEMMAAAERGEFDTLVVLNTDRLLRRQKEMVRVIDVMAGRIAIRMVEEDDLDLTTAAGRKRAQDMASAAEFESARKSERVARRWKKRSGSGRMTTGQRAIGWKWAAPCPGDSTCTHKNPHEPGEWPMRFSRAGLVPDPVEGALVAKAYELVADGATLLSVWRWLSSEGLDLTYSAGMKRMLRNPRHAGLASLGRDRVVIAEDPKGYRLVERPLWDAVQTILDSRDAAWGVGRRAGRPSNKPLSGLLRCWACGGRCNGGKATGPGGGEYRCAQRAKGTSCQKAHVRREFANTEVLKRVRDVLVELDRADIPLLTGDDGESAARARAEVVKLEAQLAEYHALAADMSPSAYAKATRAVEERLAEAVQQLVAASSRRAVADVLSDPDGVAAAFNKLVVKADVLKDAEPLRRLLHEVVERIEIRRDGSLGIVWQGEFGLDPSDVPAPPKPDRTGRDREDVHT